MLQGRSRCFGFALLVGALVAGCGGGGGGADSIAPAIGTPTDSRAVEIGGKPVVVQLTTRTAKVVTLQFPADAVVGKKSVTVYSTSQVMKAGAVPYDDTAIQIATRGLQFVRPATMSQPAPMPPEGKIYVVIVLHEGDAAWTVTATQAVLISSAAGVGVWQIDVQGSGVWAMALVDAPGSDGGVDAAAPVIPDASAPSADGAAEAVDAGTTGGVDAIVAQPSKPRLWASVTVGGAGTGDLYGYAVEQLAVDATGPTPVADYTGLAQGLYHFVFDAFGDVWGENGGGGMSRQAPPAAGSSAFPAAMAAAALSKSTVGQIFALDPAGNLWTQTNFGVCRWDKATLNAPMTSDITTSITVSATTVAFAFNAASDLIAEDLQSIRRWAASQLTGTGTITDPATRTLTFPAYSQCKWMVMDAGGNAWLIDCPSNVLMRKLTAAQLAGSGTSAATFTSFNVDAAALPNPASPTLTFDDAGNAWIAAGGGKIVEIPAADLAVDSPGQTVVLQPKLTIRAPANSNVTFRSLLWR